MSRVRSWARAVLGVPLFWKILLANAGVVGMAALLGGAVGERIVAAQQSPAGAVAALALAGVALSLLVNAVLLRLALEPIERLEDVAARVQGGDLDARAPDSPVADPSLERLARTFNAALDALTLSRRRVRRLLERSVEVEEEKRRVVARALEEETAQRLASLLVRLRLERRDPDAVELVALVDEARDEIAHALEVIRSYAGERRPAVLDELGLTAAIEAEARRVMEAHQVAIRVEAEPVNGSISDAGALAVYRIVQQALDNAVRHAEAREISVRIAPNGGSVVVGVQDDGRGFDVAASMAGEGLGLIGMHERAAIVGGRVSIASAPGVGTKVRVEVPEAGSGLSSPDPDGALHEA